MPEEPHTHPRRQVHLRPLDGRLAGPRPVRRRDPRPRSTRSRRVHRLAELGAYGVTFHDDDLMPFGRDDADRQRHIERFKAALAETGLVVPMVTTNLFTHPVFKDGGFTSNDRVGPALRAAQGDAQHGPRRRARREDLRASGAAARARRSTSPRTCAAALDRYREALDTLAQYSIDQGYGLRFAIEPKPNEPRGDILLPTDRPRPRRSSTSLEHPDMVGLNPEVGHEQMPSLNFAHGIAQALWHGKLFHIDLNGQHGPKFDQDLVFGHGDLLQRVLPRRPAREPTRTTTAPGTSTTSRCAPRTSTASGSRPRRTCAPTCCSRSGPRPSGPTRRSGGAGAPRVHELGQPTLGRGRDLRGPARRPDAFEDFDVDKAAERGYGFARLDQLAIEHLLGAR